MNKPKKRILDISYKHKLSHLGSCLTTVDIVDEIYKLKEKNEYCVLDNGHAGLAQYVVMEKYEGHNAEDLLDEMGIHPERNKNYNIAVSSGSLGLAGSIALGIALADPLVNIYVVASDGGMMEGIWYETLRNAVKLGVTNYRLVINCNGYGALSEINKDEIIAQLRGCGWGVYETDSTKDFKEVFNYESDIPIAIVMKTNVAEYSYLSGLDAHYYQLKEEDIK